MTLPIYIQYGIQELIPIEINDVTTVGNIEKKMDYRYPQHTLFLRSIIYEIFHELSYDLIDEIDSYLRKSPLERDTPLVDLGIGSERILLYQRYASWKPTESEMRNAIESYDEMEIYHSGGDRDIRYWDTSKVTNINRMFLHAWNFNVDISMWILEDGIHRV